MGLLDSLNELAKKGETLVQRSNEISKTVTNIAQNTSKAISTYSPGKKTQSKTNASVSPEKKVVAQRPADAPITFKSIGCSDKTISIIQMSLDDGIIDDRERAMLTRRIKEEGIDFQEFDFLLSKTLEAYHKRAKNCIKDLSTAFAMADRMAVKEEKANAMSLASAFPKVSGMVSNPYGLVAATASDSLIQAIGTFIKAPSKLNTFKAEIIRLIDIPLFPEVLIDFFSYASSQINEEAQRNKGKGVFTEWSETLFGKDIDLIPVWRDKMAHVMGKAVIRYGDSPQIMMQFNKWRITPLKKLKHLTDSDQIEQFPFPTNLTDFTEILKYSFKIAQEPKRPFNEAYSKLYFRVYNEGNKRFGNNPIARDILEECRMRPIMDLKTKLDNPSALVLFETPHRLGDVLEVLSFLKSRNDLKKLHQRIFNEACDIFEKDQESLKKIREFKPTNFFGF